MTQTTQKRNTSQNRQRKISKNTNFGKHPSQRTDRKWDGKNKYIRI